MYKIIRRKAARALSNILLLISCLFMIWLFVSWAEVVSKNLKPNPVYTKWNAFVLIMKGDR
jgi:predicted membrane protein